jgi:hypothetical protein
MRKRYTVKTLFFSFIVCIFMYACTKDSDTKDDPDKVVPTYGLNARGSIPSQLKNQMYIGLFENSGYDWMVNSGVPWNSRYMYLSYGWANNWGSEPYNGRFAVDFMNECYAMGAIPVFEFYVLTYIGGYTENLLGKTQDASIMNDYFEEYKLLLNKIKEFGHPVIILIEADALAVLEIQCEENSTVYAAIADSKIPELAGIPNTVAGFGLALLELKKQLYVNNASLGMHVSAWATQTDISYFSPTAPLQPEVDKVYSFLAPFGLTENQTGLEYDFLVGDPSDRDADYYRLQYNQDKWWDPSPTADINSKSFNRYAEWLRLWNVKAEKRWILWQIALGNKYHLNVPNNGNPREGYKDNRVEYFLGDNSNDNIEKFADCGVIALLFGIGASGQANFQNDVDDNGNLYMKTRASKFFGRGGMILKR